MRFIKSSDPQGRSIYEPAPSWFELATEAVVMILLVAFILLAWFLL